MNKKHRIIIPINIGALDSQWEFLRLIDGKVVKIVEICGEYSIVSQWHYDYPLFKVFNVWLEPIKEGPVSSAELYATVQANSDPGKWGNEDIGYAIKISAENERKRTKMVIDDHRQLLARISGSNQGNAPTPVYYVGAISQNWIDDQLESLKALEEDD